ncbi:MAG: ABC transporter ATP-binding protein [Gammaproteobacteria bacterium]|nr:ABC transporter ATP-binding protein [Gammaproteobacteria bacterium]MDH5651454.1 ABC transporter ATP-binding protein [Gammaproteobacteria bacterium]
MTPVLQLHSIDIHIGDKLICRDLDLTVGRGECWAILGMNGAGKTTLLHSLAGLYPTAKGQITLNGVALGTMERKLIARSMGLLLQDYEDHFPGTVMDLVLTGRHPWLSAWQWESPLDKQLALTALEKVGLVAFADRQITTLSGGERRRAALATLLTQSPDILLMDEPTNHLDIHQQHRILTLVRDLVHEQNKTAVLVLHDINLAMRYCDHALLLYEDAKPLQGEINDVMTEKNLTELFKHPLTAMDGPNSRVFLPG